MSNFQRFLERVQDRLPASEIIERHVRLRKHGKEFLGLCPFHPEKTPSFTVNDQKGFYHCFGCGAHGNIFDFIKEKEKLSFMDAVKRLADIAGYPLPTLKQEDKEVKGALDVLCETTRWFEYCLQKNHHIKEYLMGRGISFQTIQEFSLGFAPSYGLQEHLISKGFSQEVIQNAGLLSVAGEKQYDKFRDRLIFPIHDPRGRVIAFGGRALKEGGAKYLNSPETSLFQKGHTLYNYKRAKEAEGNLIIVEGYMDVMMLSQEGYRRVVAPLGTALTEHQILHAWTIDPEPILVMDGDLAGRKAQDRALERALPLLKPGHTLWFLPLPEKDDPDSFVRRTGIEGFRQTLEAKISLFDQLWKIYSPLLSGESPEKKALFEQELGLKIAVIQDEKVKNHYYALLRKKLFEHSRLRSPSVIKKTPRHVTLDQSCEKAIFLVVIEFPSILSHIFEEFARIHFSEGSHLQQEILSYFEENLPLEKESLHSYLKSKGFDKMLQALYQAQLHIPVTTDVMERWRSLYQTYENRLLTQEQQRATTMLLQDFTCEGWERYHALYNTSPDPEKNNDD